jgi:hypothetical protein
MPYRAPIIGSVWVIPIRIVTIIPVATPYIRRTGIWSDGGADIRRPTPVYIYIPAVVDINIDIISSSIDSGIPVTGGGLVFLDV